MQLSYLANEELKIATQVGPDVVNITEQLNELVRQSGIGVGLLSAFMDGSTGSLSTIEFEPGCVEDLSRALERLAPRRADYAHQQAWQDGNGHSHVQAALVGQSVTVPVRDGRLALGTWQQVVAINHDTKPRERTIAITIIGAKS